MWYVIIENPGVLWDGDVKLVFGEDEAKKYCPDSNDIAVYSLQPDGTKKREEEFERHIRGVKKGRKK
jgi:hypothetical protein